jgi:hypothetical protein
MRNPASFPLLVLALVCVPALARGGGAGALGDVLIGLMGIAIVVGLSTGLSMAAVRSPRVLVASLVVIGAAVVFATQSSAPMFFGIPLATFVAVCASAYVWARAPETTDVPDAARWVAGTHLFWAIVSLINLRFLGALAFPPLILVAGKFLFKFLPFVLPPLILAVAISIYAARLVYKRRPNLGSRARPMIFNAILFVTFLASAESYKVILMQEQLSAAHPDCISSRPFLVALSNAGDWFRLHNGYFEEAGKRYHWSYSERRFVDAPGLVPSCNGRSLNP